MRNNNHSKCYQLQTNLTNLDILLKFCLEKEKALHL